MNDSPLPDRLSFSFNYADISDLTERAYNVFKVDFVASQPIFKSKPVRTTFIIKEGNKEEGFWHVTTRNDEKTNNRVPDAQRLVRIRWMRYVIEHYSEPLVTYFSYPEGSGKTRHYFWLRSENYLVIVEEKTKYFVLVTGYLVDKNYMIQDLERKLKKYEEANKP